MAALRLLIAVGCVRQLLTYPSLSATTVANMPLSHPALCRTAGFLYCLLLHPSLDSDPHTAQEQMKISQSPCCHQLVTHMSSMYALPLNKLLLQDHVM